MYKKIPLLLFLLAFVACRPKDSTTSIKLTREGAVDLPLDSVKLSYLEFMNEEYLLKDRLDSLQHIHAPITLDKPVMGFLLVGDSFSRFFLRPGDKLIANLEMKEDGSSVFNFTCDDSNNNVAHINNYLSQTINAYNEVRNKSFAKDIDQFLISFDSLSTKMKDYHQHFLDSILLEPNEIEMLRKINDLQLIETKVLYTFRKHNDFLVSQIYAHRDGKEIQQYETPDQLKNVLSDLALDTVLLTSAIYNSFYTSILWAYAQEKFEMPLFNPKKWNQPNPQLPSIIQSSIMKEPYPGLLQEYLQAQNINEFMIHRGLTPVIDSLYSRFSLDFPNSKYAIALEEKFNKQTTVLPGEVAPNFTGTKVDSTRISLSDFKGRVVYVDVWATWCGPCVEEIPHSIQLQKEFENNPDVIFLNVSVDSNVEAWRKKIAKEPSWGNVHINLNKKEAEQLIELYKVTGYPKYFLIDKDGKIVTVQAARPSSKERIANEIKRLVNKRASM
jgi:thiol-disulfide isomerase/thioredoxin